MFNLLKIILSLIFWGVFIFVVLQTPYPESLAQASLIQIIYFFLPLYFALLFSFNLFLKNILISGSISLGLILLLTLKALDSLNLITTILIGISVYLLISYFRKSKKSGLTYSSKIPKLHSLRRRKQ